MEEQGLLNPDGSLVNETYLNQEPSDDGVIVFDDGDGELAARCGNDRCQPGQY